MLLAVQQFKDFIKSYNLFKPQDKILLAVSGGKDSVTMAHLFASAGFKFGIAHCNFNLRGAESLRDQAFVEALAKALNVDFHLQSFDTEIYAREHKLSIQMAARELRYQYFNTLKSEFNYQKIAIAQHQNDAMETVLLNLIRGTGIAGLHGIRVEHHDIIRPLLCFNSANIEEMVEENNISYVEDSSNASTKYARNKIRLDIIPEMKKLNPSLEDTFQKNLDYFSDLESLLIETVKNYQQALFVSKGKQIEIEIQELQKVYPQKLIFFELFKPFGFNMTTIHNLVSCMNANEPGKQFFSDTRIITVDREKLFIKEKEHLILREQFINKGQEEAIFGNYHLSLKEVNQKPVDFKTEQSKIYVNADALVYPLKLRAWREGDYFKPFGMQGEKKVSDFLISQKVPLEDKKSIPILANGDGKIIWVGGLRNDDRFKVTNNTEKIFILELLKN
ncbi:tRNA lysidine(34) synthetase TilS [Pelobium sp.]|nr:tRNA lysidine(34) synthetase TilS [Pelobium sp.]MDA9554994.1 tRNA lysidine(34) synthetase TilS [Pelobium sp.]